MRVSQIGPLLAAGLIGGAAALAGAAVLEGGEADAEPSVREVAAQRLLQPRGVLLADASDAFSLAEIYEQVRGGVVQVSATSRMQRMERDPVFGLPHGAREELRQGLGSGFVVAQLIAHGRVERAYLGIGVAPVDAELAALFRLPAARGGLVQRVDPASPAARAGLRAGTTTVVVAGESYVLGGDLVVSLAGRPVGSDRSLRQALTAERPGGRVEVELFRGGERRSLTLQLGRRPTSLG